MKSRDILFDKVKEVLLKKNYPFYIGEMNLNFVGIRTSNTKADNFDDFFCLLWKEKGEKRFWICDEFTTDPGLYYLQKKLLNPKGCAIMVPSHYKSLWTIGLHGNHNPYRAFVQIGKVKVYRDRDKDEVLDLDPATIQESAYLGINLHHGFDSKLVGPNSAGCQVFKHDKDLNFLLTLADKSSKFYGKKFSYSLLEEKDFTV